jgi:signal transduction histidine kinase
MTFSRDVKICFEKMPVTDMVKDCVLTFSALCDEHDIKIDARYGTDLPVLVDKGQAAQAAKNLISNAIDVMPNGGVLTITTAAEKLHDVTFVAAHISDTGPGIPVERLPLIFEPFHTTKEIGRGTGLGLSISRKIIEEHGGFITAENRRTGGLRASLFFPYQSDEDLCKVPCWEFMRCERHTGKEMKCPAYPHFGRVCWVVGGTFCEGKIHGTFAQKCADCRKCEFYEKVVSGKI